MTKVRTLCQTSLAAVLVLTWTSWTNAGDHDCYRIAKQLEEAACSLEHEIVYQFSTAPGYYEHVHMASMLKVNAQQARMLLHQGAPASVIRGLAKRLERDADRLENCIEDLDYRDYHIDRECYRHAVKLADRIEDLADEFADELEDFDRRRVRYTPIRVAPAYGQPYYPPVQSYDPSGSAPLVPGTPELPAAPGVPTVPSQPFNEVIPPQAPVAPPLPDNGLGQRQQQGPVILPAGHGVRRAPTQRYEPPVVEREEQQPRRARSVRIGPFSITF